MISAWWANPKIGPNYWIEPNSPADVCVGSNNRKKENIAVSSLLALSGDQGNKQVNFSEILILLHFLFCFAPTQHIGVADRRVIII